MTADGAPFYIHLGHGKTKEVFRNKDKCHWGRAKDVAPLFTQELDLAFNNVKPKDRYFVLD